MSITNEQLKAVSKQHAKNEAKYGEKYKQIVEKYSLRLEEGFTVDGDLLLITDKLRAEIDNLPEPDKALMDLKHTPIERMIRTIYEAGFEAGSRCIGADKIQYEAMLDEEYDEWLEDNHRMFTEPITIRRKPKRSESLC